MGNGRSLGAAWVGRVRVPVSMTTATTRSMARSTRGAAAYGVAGFGAVVDIGGPLPSRSRAELTGCGGGETRDRPCGHPGPQALTAIDGRLVRFCSAVERSGRTGYGGGTGVRGRPGRLE